MKEDDLTVTAAGRPAAAHHALRDRDDRTVEVHGRLIGSGTSYKDGKPRWFEVDIYETVDGRFAVYTRGCSNVAGEKPLRRLIFTPSAFEVLSLLVVHRNGKSYLPRASDRALSLAASYNDDIRDAYINRAVT